MCCLEIFAECVGVEIRGVCILLPHTADQGKNARRKLYGDNLAKKVMLTIQKYIL